jgi:hypothetical protein
MMSFGFLDEFKYWKIVENMMKLQSIKNSLGHALAIIIMQIFFFHRFVLFKHRFYVPKTCMKRVHVECKIFIHKSS